MKIALCISGQPRFITRTCEVVKNNILLPNNPVDVFMHTWYSPELAGVPFDSAQPGQSGKVGTWEPDTDKIIETTLCPVGVLKLKCSAPMQFDHLSHLPNLESAVQIRLASMFYSCKESIELKKKYEEENNFKYDVVIRTRIDLGYSKPVVVTDIVDGDIKNTLYVPERHQHMRMGDSYPIRSGGKYSSMSDTFIVGSSENIDRLGELYDNFESIHREIFPFAYGEAFLGYHVFHTNKLNISMKDIQYAIYRG